MLELRGGSGVDVNQANIEGVSPLCLACELGYEHAVDCLLGAHGINVDHELRNGATALAIAASHGHVKIIESLASHSQRNGIKMPVGVFPVQDQFENTELYHDAVLAWAEAAVSHATSQKQNIGSSKQNSSLFRKRSGRTS
jgi:ankyrin repeat protein